MDGRGKMRPAEQEESLRAASFDALPMPAVIIGADKAHPVLHANPAAARLLSLSGAVAGRPATEALPFDPAPYVRRLLDGDVVREEHIPDRGLRSRRWQVSLAPLLSETDGSVEAIVVCLVDATGDALERSDERAVLHELATTLATEVHSARVHEQVVHGAVRTTNAERAALYLADDATSFELLAWTGDHPPPPRFEVTDATSASWQVPLGRIGLAWDSDDPPADLPLAESRGWQTGLAAGFHGPRQGLALLVVGEPLAGGYADGALERLEIVAAMSGRALASVRLVEDQRELERLLAGAVEISAGLAGATSPEEVHRRLLDGLVDAMGVAGAALWAPPEDASDGALTLVDSAALPDEVREQLEHLPASSVAAGLASRAPHDNVVEAVGFATRSSWPEHAVHLVALPEPARGVLGVYTRRRLPELVGGVLATLAQAVAAAEQQTGLHLKSRAVVDSLQRELRPTTVELPGGVGVGWVYRSATSGVEVGGDFYDVFTTTSGHIGVACGDVAGKGVEAASLTALAVHTLRAFALRGTAPQVVLSMLNGIVCKQTSAERFMTLAYARIDPADWSVSLTLAGHPSPLVVGPSGVRVLDLPPDLPAGVDESAAFEEHALSLEPGESLILVTDGVTEARRRGHPGELLGADGIAEALAEHAGQTPQEVADRVWEAVEEWTGGGTNDDCAVVVFSRLPQG